jgi:flagellar basal-body rod protein FlgB
MVPTRVPLFGLLSARMAWLSERQTVLSQNVANADTPGYRPKDVSQPDFQRLLAKGVARLEMARTDAGHLGGGASARLSVDGREQRRTFEVAPSGNAVVLEEQMAKLGETFLDYQLSSNLYRKQVSMVRTALGRGGGGG